MSSRKGKKPKSGEPLFYEEKKIQASIQITPTAKDALTQAATELGISRSELIERLGRKGKDWLVKEGSLPE